VLSVAQILGGTVLLTGVVLAETARTASAARTPELPAT
jgi:hypothetical protein